MPVLRDPAAIRAILETDRPWSVYALGDLAPGFFENCLWYQPAGGTGGLALVYRAFATPVLFTIGRAAELAKIFDEITEPAMYLHVRPEIVPVLAARYRVSELRNMWRMVLDPGAFRPIAAPEAVRLSTHNLNHLLQLFADGAASGESPDFFSPAMLDNGVYYAVREEGQLIAAAGTHLVIPAESVGAVGNVYTRKDRRGRGLASRVTSAVVHELLRLKLRTVALNVNQQNTGAIRIYERLGFVRYCEFCEGVIER